MSSEDISLYNRIGRLCLAIQMFIAFLGLLGYVSGFHLLGSICPGFKTMAVSTALFFLTLGLISIFSDMLNRWAQITAMFFSVLTAFYGIAVFIGYLLGQKESFEAYFVDVSEKLGGIPLRVMSTPAGLVFFFAGLSVFFILLNKFNGRKNKLFAHLAGICASIVFLFGAVFALGYLYNQPFLYGKSGIVPMALTTAIAFCFLGLGQMFLASDAYPLVLLAGSETNKILARKIIPLAVIMLILFIVRDIINRIFHINAAFLVSGISIISVIVIVFVVMRTSSAVNSLIERIARFPSENPNPVLRVDDKGVIIYANKASKELLAYWQTGVEGLIPEKWKKMIKIASESKITVCEEAGISDKVFLFTIIFLKDEGYFNIYAMDITERKKIQEALQASETRYRRLFETAKDGILILDAETGKVIDANPFLTELLGFSREYFLGKRIPELGFLKDSAVNQQNFLELQQKGYIRYEDLPLQAADGREIEVEFVSNVYQVNHQKVIQCNIRDITERKKAQEALRQNENYLKDIFNSVQIGIMLIDAESHLIEDVNPAIIKLFGAPREQIIGELCHNYICPAEKGKCPITDLRQKVDNSERFLINANGQKIPVIKTVIPVTLKNRDFLLESFMDITERKNIEEELERYKAALENILLDKTEELQTTYSKLADSKRLSDIGTLAATVAHELRNPLGVIKAAVYNIKRKTSDGSLDSHLANIDKKIDESNRIITNLLGYSRIKTPHYEDVVFLDILNSCAENIRSRYAKWDVKLDIKSNCAPGDTIEADPLLLNEIFYNILDNSYQAFVDKKGAVEINLDYNKQENALTIIFRDNGIGIDEKDLPNISTPFFTTKARGIGLGLAMCKQIAGLHYGKLDIESKKGEGTAVTVRLPIRRTV